jgi:hypothetical protein
MNPNEKGRCVEKSANPLKRERSKRDSDRKNKELEWQPSPLKTDFQVFSSKFLQENRPKNDESGGSHEQLGKKYF